MKILKPGIPPSPKESPWWIGKDAACMSCGAIMRLEKGDIVVETEPIAVMGQQTGIITAVGFQCPHCGRSVVVRRPAKVPGDLLATIDTNITIITGAQGTGKGYVAQALASLESKTIIFEVRSLEEVHNAFVNKIKDSKLFPVFVCTDTFTFTPHDLFLFNGKRVNSAYLIHLSHPAEP